MLAGCALPRSLEDPAIQVSPYYATYKLTGTTALQSVGDTGAIEDNQRMKLESFGYDDHEDDVGLRVDVGDGFGGFRIDYLRLDNSSTRKGVLADDWGVLRQGDPVHVAAELDEFRIGYVGEVLAHRFGERDRAVDVRLGVGAVLAHRDLALRVQEDNGLRSQNINHSDRGVIYPALRARATWRDFYLDGEYAWSPNLNLGGDFDGDQHDLELRLGYAVPLQDVAVFAAWRLSQWEIDGRIGVLRHEADLQLTGWQFGVQIKL